MASMTVEPSIQPDGALLLKVKSDDYPTQDAFWNGGGLKLALQGVRESIGGGGMTDMRIIAFFENNGKGRDIAVELRRFDGTLIEADGRSKH